MAPNVKSSYTFSGGGGGGSSSSSINNNHNTHTVNISIRDHRQPPAPPGGSVNTSNGRSNSDPYSTIGVNGRSAGTTRRQPQQAQRAVRQGPHHPSPSPARKSQAPQPSSSNSPRKPVASAAATPKVNGKPRQSIFAQKARDDLESCKNCGRNFASDRIEKHEEICFKTSKKKRKTFDSTKKRVEGTDAATFVLNTKKGKAAASRSKAPSTQGAGSGGKKSDWRKKRQEFIETLRAAKAAQRHLAAGGKLSDLPPPPPMDTSDYVQCPHCNRKFNEAAADRHIPKCKNIKSNKR